MLVRILGTRGEIEENSKTHFYHSGYVISHGDDSLILDYGANLGSEKFPVKKRVGGNLLAVILTHAHPDHSFGIQEDTPTIGIAGVKEAVVREGGLMLDSWKSIPLEQWVRRGPFLIKAYRTMHSKKTPSAAYKIRVPGHGTVFFSSDVISIRNRDDALRDVDLYIGDGSSIEKDIIRRDPKTGEIYGHSSVKTQLGWLGKAGIEHAIFTHWGKEAIEMGDEELLRKLDHLYEETKLDKTEDIRIGKDGMTIQIETLALTGTAEVAPLMPKRIIKVEEAKTGLYLKPPHGELIAKGDKTMIVKQKKFGEHIGEPIYIIDDKVCYGVIRLEEPEEISPTKFWEYQERHKVTKEEFKEWGWENVDKFYAYRVIVDKIWAVPRPVEIPQGVQNWVSASSLRWLKSHSLELFMEREEMIRKRAKDYDPAQMRLDQVRDDWRIASAWYCSTKRGKKLQFADGSPITEDDILLIGEKIMKHLVSKEAIVFHPSTMRECSRGFYDKVKDRMPKDMKVPEEEEMVAIPFPPEDIKAVDDVYAGKLSDSQLEKTHKWLHEQIPKEGSMPEDLVNAHVFIVREMITRGIDHNIEDELDKKSQIVVQEYPKAPLSLVELKKITLREVYDMLPDVLPSKDPAPMFLVGGLVNRGWAGDGHDIDILVKSERLDLGAVRRILKVFPRKMWGNIHFVPDVEGPEIGFSIPIFAKGLVKVPFREPKREKLSEEELIEVGSAFKPMKACSGKHKCEFFEPQDLYDRWVADHLEHGIAIQPKFDGMRMIAHKRGDEIKLITEDRLRDRASFFPESVKDFKDIKGPYILDTEMVEYSEKEFPKGKGKIFEKYEQFPRENLIPWIVADKPPRDDTRVVFHIHDILWHPQKGDVHELPYRERLSLLKDLVPTPKHLEVVRTWYVNTPKQFDDALEEARNYPNSEGAMLKDLQGKYEIARRSPMWAKIKNVKEIDVMVWKVEKPVSKETGKPVAGAWNYRSCVGPISAKEKEKYREKDIIEMKGRLYLNIGKTYNAGFKADVGDIIIVEPIRIAKFEEEGKTYYTWMFPNPRERAPGKKEPDPLDVVEKLVKVGTATLSLLSPEELSELTKAGKSLDSIKKIELSKCPYGDDDEICPLKKRFFRPREEMSKVKLMRLKYPMKCPLASSFRCIYIKPYYYGYEEIEIPEEVTQALDKEET